MKLTTIIYRNPNSNRRNKNLIFSMSKGNSIIEGNKVFHVGDYISDKTVAAFMKRSDLDVDLSVNFSA